MKELINEQIQFNSVGNYFYLDAHYQLIMPEYRNIMQKIRDFEDKISDNEVVKINDLVCVVIKLKHSTIYNPL